MSAPPSGSDQQIPSLPHTMSEPIRSISSDSATQPSLLNPGMATNPTSGLTLLEPPRPCGSKTLSSIFQDTTDSPAPDLTNRIDDAMQPINKTHAKVHDMSSLPHAHSSDQLSNSLSSPCFVHSYLDRGVALGESLKKQRRQLARQRRSKSSRQISQNDVASADDDSTPQSQLTHAQPTSQERKASSSSESPQASSSQSRSGLISTDRAQALATEDDSLSSSDATSTYIKRRTERASARVRIRTSSDDDDDDDDDRDADNVAHQPLSDQDSSYGSSYSYSTDEEDSDKVRSLTRQLAETAVGVREMSKQLGRARVKSTIQSVMIITKARDNHLIKLTRELAIWLMTTPRNGKDTGLIVYVDSQLRQSKRFDAEGIRRDYPQLFDSRPKRTPSLSSSFTSTSGHDNNGSFNRTEGGNQLRFWNADMCSRSPHLFDFVVTLGGDGTVLFCSWLFQRIVPPVLPFALGSLGFLTNFDFKAYREVMKSALDDGIRVNLRMRFTATVYRATLPTSSSADRHRRQAIKSGKTGEIILNSVKSCGWNAIESPNPEQGHSGHRPRSPTRPDEEVEVPSMEKTSKKKGKKGKKCRDKEIMCFSTRPVETFEVLNDLVVDRGPSPYVSLLEVFGDEHHMTTAQADGLCISTPTGSTAYSLSAGGSLVHPEIPAILITPICPHTLSFRPMLLPDSMELRIAVPYNSRSTAWASFDGRGRVELKQGDHIKVTASRYPFPTVCAENQSTDWFSSISRTLKWNERQRQKSFVVVEEGADPDSGNNQEKGKDSASDASPNKMFAKHGHNGDQDSSSDDDEDGSDEDDDDEKGEDEEDEDAEKFDIDDTSTTVTRSNSPNSHGDGHVRRRSGQSTARHANGAPRRSSGPSLLSSSLPRLTSIANAFGPKPGEEHSSGHGHAKEGTSSTASSNPGSLLNSPDRFGLQGPPNPPKAISERHLANADFRLDGVRALSSSSVPTVGSSSSKGAGSGSGSVPRAARTIECGRSWSSRDKPMTPSSALAREKTPQGLRFDSVKEVGRRSIEQNADRYDRSSNNDTGGTALVVYGEDESDSDSTTGAGH